MSDHNEDEIYIYESPDRGHTVYRRLPGSTERELVSQRSSTESDKLDRWHRWREILERSSTDAVLENLIQQVEIYDQLRK